MSKTNSSKVKSVRREGAGTATAFSPAPLAIPDLKTSIIEMYENRLESRGRQIEEMDKKAEINKILLTAVVEGLYQERLTLLAQMAKIDMRLRAFGYEVPPGSPLNLIEESRFI